MHRSINGSGRTLPFRLWVLACAFLAASMGVGAQTVGVSTQKSAAATTNPAVSTSPAIPPDREKELLDRIERLEKRLSDLERVAFGPASAAPATTTAAVSNEPAKDLSAAVASNTDTTATGTAPAKKQDDKKYLEQGILPASIKLPGTDISMRIGGYVKVDVNHDFQAIGNQSQFATNTIPIEGTPNADLGASTIIQAKETRFTFELGGGEGKNKFRTYVEGDFYAESNTFRLRHAYGEFRGFLIGQTWTTFMDISSRPRTLDYEGPDGEIFVRQAMVRYTGEIAKNWKFALAAENPAVQIVIPSSMTGSDRANMPDFVGLIRYGNERGHLQFASLLRSLRFDGTGSTPDESTLGWGFNTSFRLNTWGKDALMGEFAFGSGISRYIESMGGQNVDAVFTSTGGLEAIPGRAAVIGYERHWTPTLMSAFAYSIADISSNTAFSSSVIKRTQDARFNLIWTPFKLIDLGAEVLWGQRRNQDGTQGDAVRIMFSTIYRFN